MGNDSGKSEEGKICVGLLAHVDAGKTTLAEAILYLTGAIRSLGRVDHKDAFLDNFELERKRGITIFSKQAQVGELTLLDTPGHVDFSAEMERTLQVLDCAVLVISGTDGVQSHTKTLWRLLARYEIPTFLFVNKMDLAGSDRAVILEELQRELDTRCVDFTEAPDAESFQENVAVCDEELLDSYLAGSAITVEKLRDMTASRLLFPVYFGSALKLKGVEELLAGLRRYALSPDYPEEFGARVYKISRDAQGNRLTHMKITGGTLQVRDTLTTAGGEQEKVTQIQIYSGANYETVSEAKAGTLLAVTGLEHSCAGEGLGIEPEAEVPLLEPVLSYRILLPEGTDVHEAYREFKTLEEEEPELHISWDEKSQEIHAQLMGEVQTEILQTMIQERFGLTAVFGEGSIVYCETIAAPVVGIGHFEPLRHYAEAHLLLEPAERGSGLSFSSVVSEDKLDGNWQKLILSHLEECSHPGVLTGSDITDMRITLVAGRASIKHTEGGDFRQATFRALRQGLCRAESILLEPVYAFRMELPAESVGRALSDIQRMYGSADAPVIGKEQTVITGTAPVGTMRGYQSELLSYTKGQGRLFCRLQGYAPCHNAQEVIEARAYDPQADPDHPCGSVFCAHGAGYAVSWEEVPSYAHIQGTDAYADAAAAGMRGEEEDVGGTVQNPLLTPVRENASQKEVDDEELRAIFERTYGSVKSKRKGYHYSKDPGSAWAGRERTARPKKQEAAEECLLVDGYNIIFAWDELRELSKTSLEAARGRLLDIMSNYQGYRGNHLIVVFDAYRVAGHVTEVSHWHNIYVVFTKEAETADQYIEKTVREIGHRYQITVATSDGLEQVIILGAGAYRMSARELAEEVDRMNRDLRENYTDTAETGTKSYLLDGREDLKNDLQ